MLTRSCGATATSIADTTVNMFLNLPPSPMAHIIYFDDMTRTQKPDEVKAYMNV